MKVLLSWLNELAPLGDDVDGIAADLTDLGLAVEGIERVGAPVPGVVVAKVLALRQHPDADRVQLVDVDPGDGEALQIGCGAFNMAVGDLVPLAGIGAVLPGGLEISRRKLRGQWSNGMLCSPRELGVGDDHAGIWILPPSTGPLGADLFAAIGIHPDVVFDLDVSRNRPDAFCHLGVARDLAARRHVPLVVPSTDIKGEGDATVTVALEDRRRCGRFTALVIEGVEVGASPSWLAERLRRSGMRPINNVVDASNYVMLDVGHPNHPYDEATLGGGGFRVRVARPGEEIVTLDGVRRSMTDEDLLICDALDAPVGIAGVMGGEHTEISPATTEVVLEMAWFDPLSIAATASRAGLRSEASARFERGVDPELAGRAGARFVELLRLTCPQLRVRTPVEAVGDVPGPAVLTLRTERVNAILGLELDDHDVRRLLEPLGFTVQSEHAGVQAVTVPSWRLDCTQEIDLVEEVARHHGYAASPRVVARSARGGALSPYQRDRRRVAEVLVGLGATEVMPNPFLAPGDLERAGLEPAGLAITNPLVTEESVLRTSLRPGLLKAIAFNASHRRSGVELFEIGHVVRRPAPTKVSELRELPDEREVVAVALAGSEATVSAGWWRALAAALVVDGWRIEAAEAPGLHPTRSARIASGGDELGWIGEIDPEVLRAYEIGERVAWLEVDLGALLALPHGVTQYRPVSRFPSSDVDLALAVPDAVPASAIEAALRAGGGNLLVDLSLFDVYRGGTVPAGARSLAYRLRLQADDHTLTEGELAEIRQRVIEAALAAGGTLR